MEKVISLSGLSLVVLVEWFCPVYTDSLGRMTPPSRHRGFFYKQPKGSNKTIPVSENPGKELLAFDVDGTLWPYHIDSDPIFQDPFSIRSFDNGTVLVGNHSIEAFPEVQDVMVELKQKGYVLAAVSLTNSTSKTMALLNAFDLTQHFTYMEMATGPDKMSLITEIVGRSDILLEDVLYFEKDPQEVIDMIWRHVIVCCVDEKGITKDRVRKGLYIFDIRPRKERREQGQHYKSGKREKSNKNKSRPAYEKDGTELEGMDNFTAIEYFDRQM